MSNDAKRIVPPVTYRNGEFAWYIHKDLDPLDEPVREAYDARAVGEATLKIMLDLGLIPHELDVHIGLADQVREPLRAGDILSPLMEKLGLEPYRDLPPRPELPPIISYVFYSLDEEGTDERRDIFLQYARLGMFTDRSLLGALKISEITSARYYAILLRHFSEKPLEAVEEFLSSRANTLAYQMYHRLNYWRINGEMLSDLYESLCKFKSCTGDCESTHIQGLDYRGLCLLAAVLEEAPLEQPKLSKSKKPSDRNRYKII